MTHGRERRRQLVVNKSLQSRLIMAASWPSTLALVMAAIVLAGLCQNLAAEVKSIGAELPSVLPLMLTVIVFLFVATGFLILNSLRISNQVAGPMYRLSRTLEAFRNGDTSSRAHLRSGDFLMDLADDVNDFLDWAEEFAPQNEQTGKDEDASTPQGASDEPTDGETTADTMTTEASATDPEETSTKS